jgi:SAM-dependent methyltransferase
MQNSNEIKEMVKEQYGRIASQNNEQDPSSCCTGFCCTGVENIMADDYSTLKGYHDEANLGLGCGLPTQFATIKAGDVVIDLGSGAGNDCFIARSETGETGKVIGIDFTEKMISRARANAQKLNYQNVEFRSGDIENLPVESDYADVVISNCVLNLVPDKKKVFSEIYRVLKPGAHFSISDIVLNGQLPQALLNEAEMYAGCIAGSIQKNAYIDLIKEAGFKNIKIQKEKKILIPQEILATYLSPDDLQIYNKQEAGITSITVYAEKASCCNSTCCK